MSVRLRLQRHGRKKAPFYHIVAANSTSPRDGRFIERIGYYNPTKVPAQITLEVDKAVQWLQDGAEPTTTVKAILKYKGVLYKKHLLRGLKKGALTPEQVEEKFAEWQNAHKGAVLDHLKTIEDKAAQAKSAEIARIESKRREKADAEAKAIAEAKAAEEAATKAAEVVEEASVAEINEPETDAADMDAATSEEPVNE